MEEARASNLDRSHLNREGASTSFTGNEAVSREGGDRVGKERAPSLMGVKGLLLTNG